MSQRGNSGTGCFHVSCTMIADLGTGQGSFLKWAPGIILPGLSHAHCALNCWLRTCFWRLSSSAQLLMQLCSLSWDWFIWERLGWVRGKNLLTVSQTCRYHQRNPLSSFLGCVDFCKLPGCDFMHKGTLQWPCLNGDGGGEWILKLALLPKQPGWPQGVPPHTLFLGSVFPTWPAPTKVTVPTHALRWPCIHWEAMKFPDSFATSQSKVLVLPLKGECTFIRRWFVFTSKKTWRAAYYVFLNLWLLTFVA